jgi:hypothetical protein
MAFMVKYHREDDYFTLTTLVISATLAAVTYLEKSRFVAVVFLLFTLAMLLVHIIYFGPIMQRVGPPAAPLGLLVLAVISLRLTFMFHRLPKGYDLEKWRMLVKCDPEIAKTVEQLRPLGENSIHELARMYLTLCDKRYLENIAEEIRRQAQTIGPHKMQSSSP